MSDLYEFIFSDQLPFADKMNQVFRFQFRNNLLFRDFSQALGISDQKEFDPSDAPLLPIEAFRDHVVISCSEIPLLQFKSSGTAGSRRSTHYIADPELYRLSVLKGMERVFPIGQYSFLFLLPGYSDNEHSSLIKMAEHLISGEPDGLSGTFFTDEMERAEALFHRIVEQQKKPILFAAAFGLLDLLDTTELRLPNCCQIIETGGMKTYRREVTKSELRERLSHGFGIPLPQIHSEYGMCELFSQMYAVSGEWFHTPPWVSVTIRDPENPLRVCDEGEEGRIGIIDLANYYSCSFILTEDRGIMNHAGEFQVLGRGKGSELRGCNFLFENGISSEGSESN